MKYRLNTTNYWDFNTVEVNKLPGRSYFIPYPDRKKADAVSPKEKRYASEKVLCLNGDWDFKFYPRPAELPTEFDTDAVSFDTIDVPSCWQFRGYDRPFYVNIRYQFPFDPPRIPKTEKVGKLFYILGADKGIGPRTVDPGEEYNFVGVYRRSITIGVVAVDCKLTKEQCNRLADLAHDGLARTIRPVHTQMDGDTVFSLATGRVSNDVNFIKLCAAASEVMARAIANAILFSLDA